MLVRYDAIAIYFGEIWLKGRNRGGFIRRLHDNIRLSLKGQQYDKLENARDRFILRLTDSSDTDAIMDILGHVFGISWFAPVVMAGNGLDQIVAAANELMKDVGKGTTVRIVASRSHKGVGYDSQGLVREFARRENELTFSLDKDAKDRLFINVRKDDALLCAKRVKGLGGLPVGSSGRAVVLLSGGIDSPVASYYAMKRGLMPVYLHMHGFPENKEAESSKMKDIIAVLSRYAPTAKTYYVPAHIFQAAVFKVPRSQELVLFKHFLYMMAERVAKMERAEVIATGESLGQVASQTVRNLGASQAGVKSLVFRPLIGFDKQEIIDIAKSIGTYDLSVAPYVDVCSLKARHPATGAKAEVVRRLYRECKLGGVLGRTLKKASVVQLSP